MNKPEKSSADRALLRLAAHFEHSLRCDDPIYLDERKCFQLLDHYESAGDLHHATQVADRAIELYRFSPDFYLRKARLLLQSRRDEAALDVLDRAAAFAPRDAELLLLRAEVLAYLGEYAAAHTALNDLEPARTHDDRSDQLLVRALIYERQADYAAMYRTVREVLRIEPGNEEAQEQLFEAVRLGRLRSEGIEAFQAVIDESPFSYQAWFYLGCLSAEAGHHGAALEAYDYSVVIREDFQPGYQAYAALCFDLQRHRQALEAYQEIVRRFEVDEEVFWQMGRCYQSLGLQAEAREQFRQAIKLDPNQPEGHFYLGESYAQEERWEQALRCFERAVALDNEDADFQIALAQAAFENRLMDRAEKAFERAIHLAPNEGQLWLAFAWFLVWTEREHAAVELLAEAEDRAPGHELAYGFVTLLLGLRRRQEALSRLSEALVEYYDEHELLFEFMPDLREDGEVLSMITLYGPWGDRRS